MIASTQREILLTEFSNLLQHLRAPLAAKERIRRRSQQSRRILIESSFGFPTAEATKFENNVIVIDSRAKVDYTSIMYCTTIASRQRRRRRRRGTKSTFKVDKNKRHTILFLSFLHSSEKAGRSRHENCLEERLNKVFYIACLSFLFPGR